MFAGVAAARVNSLYYTARKKAPCIIFIDEVDAIGRSRCASLSGGGGEGCGRAGRPVVWHAQGFAWFACVGRVWAWRRARANGPLYTPPPTLYIVYPATPLPHPPPPLVSFPPPPRTTLGNDPGSMERESALLAMLVQMDGIHGDLEQVGWGAWGMGH